MTLVRKHGFTLIELMIVIAILALIVAIAIPKFGSLVSKSRESNTKGNLGAIRSALSIYYGQNEAHYPSDNLDSLAANGHFLEMIPPANLPPTQNSPGHGGGPINNVITGTIPTAIDDVADGHSGWLYDNVSGDELYGSVIVNCTHSDVYGVNWTTY